MAADKPNYLRPTNADAHWARGFWQGLRDKKLLAGQCRGCQETFFPPRPRCPECLGDDLEWTELSGRGTLKSWTRIRVASQEFDTPFLLGLVELEGGMGRISAKIVADDDHPLAVGMPVRIGFLDLDPDFALYCIAPQ